MLVRIVKDWDWPDPNRQTPGGAGRWDDIEFTLDPVETCDYVIVLNCVKAPVTVHCPPQHVWALMQEPPVWLKKIIHKGQKAFHRIYTTHPGLSSPRYVHTHPALPWFVNRTYDQLKACPPPEKSRDLSWITSNLRYLPGHRRRMEFLTDIQKSIKFDLYGRGFCFVEDKWDALGPYRYSLAIENYSGPDYWTEKLSDCLLAWSMPIYYGCTNIEKYLPPECMVRIDIERPDVIDQIRQIISSDLWLKRRDAIAEARRLILDMHQLFPFLAQAIRAEEATHSLGQSPPCPVVLQPLREGPWITLGRKIFHLLRPTKA